VNLGAQFIAYVIGLPLQLMVISALVRGPWRHYPFVLAYVSGDFVTSLMEFQPSLTYSISTPAARRSFTLIYWWDERLMQILVFLLILSLIYRAAASLPWRRLLMCGVSAGILLFAGLTLLLYHDPAVSTGKWMTPWLRNLNFCAAVLDMALWALLIGARRKNYRLLMLSGALGIQFTGGAIGQALRQLSHSSTVITAYSICLANLAALYIIWQAFRYPARHAGEEPSSGT
jgi:hypothetical protein